MKSCARGVGNRLHTIREERKLTQAEMAELIDVSPSSYSRIERNEASLELDQVVNIAKKLQIPIHELLTETLAIHNTSHNGQGGLIFGNYYNYGDSSEPIIKNLEQQLALKEQELNFLREKIDLLEKQNDLLTSLIKGKV